MWICPKIRNNVSILDLCIYVAVCGYRTRKNAIDQDRCHLKVIWTFTVLGLRRLVTFSFCVGSKPLSDERISYDLVQGGRAEYYGHSVANF